ncbi:hydroxymethylbilane synthase [Cellulomonas soli]|uniref:Porphobilinogen deaminase n=1 Tax=Cellulomonas soli TaxID=931535 RepID=A0A512PI14_9CELL|nr:hydroxymethylbilane synthase [Cellulomonas soli]NYI58771.1 hydroxymethylbilane synthase [Cellulomonas soli]GEP70849.1 porphobilinogen deaminase [Cellulomonas soli]
MPQHVRVGTRASILALTQTGHVAQALATLAAHPGSESLTVETVRVRTDGDRLTGSLASLGGTGVFVTALRDALLDGRCDLAVHSLKDLPTGPADGLVLGAVPLRQDPRDALCARDGLTLATLPTGARVGTGSPRRAAQLLAARPDLDVVDIRGNVDTRLRRVAPGDLDAVVLARAGLARLERLDQVTETFEPDVMAPAPGQGALAVEVRTADADGTTPLARALRALDHRPTRLAVVAERALLARLEAGCAAPVGALGRLDDDGRTLHLDAVVARTDGTRTLRRSSTTVLGAVAGASPAAGTLADALAEAQADTLAAEQLGRALAEQLLDAGAAELAELGATR